MFTLKQPNKVLCNLGLEKEGGLGKGGHIWKRKEGLEKDGELGKGGRSWEMKDGKCVSISMYFMSSTIDIHLFFMFVF